MITSLFTQFADACQPKGSFFGLPTWYKYLDGVQGTNGVTDCIVRINKLADFWLVASAILELLLRLAALAAIAMIVYGGIQFVTSDGQPDKAQKALGTVVAAAVGLVIAVASTAVITFVAGRFN